MAVQLKKTTAFNIGVVVNNAISAVKTVRLQEQSRKEAEFQKAVADGLSYEAQLEFRENQLKEAKESGFIDQEYINKLEETITTTKRLARFSKYRTKYAESLADMNAGRINAEEYVKTLQSFLPTTTDPALREEILTNIAAAETQVTAYKNTILTNQVKRAQYDGTEKALKDAMKKVKEARSRAAINGNEDEVEEYDLTLAALNSQLVQTRAEDVVNDIAVKGMMTGFDAKSKLSTLNTQIGNADTDTPVTIDGRKYESEKQYWEITRSAYLSGNGSGVFADYFSEVEAAYKSKIDADVARFGFATPTTIKGIRNDFSSIRSNPELAPFVERFNSLESVVVGVAVDTMAKTIVDRATYTGDFVGADNALKTLGTTYGVDTSGSQLQLANNLNQQINAAISAGEAVPSELTNLLPASDFPTPQGDVPAPAPTPSSTPAPTPTAVKPMVDENYYMRPGETVSAYNQRIMDYRASKKNAAGTKTTAPTSTVTTPAPAPAPTVTPTPSVPPESAPVNTPSPALKKLSIDNAPKSGTEPTQEELDAMEIQLKGAEKDIKKIAKQKGVNLDNIKK